VRRWSPPAQAGKGFAAFCYGLRCALPRDNREEGAVPMPRNETNRPAAAAVLLAVALSLPGDGLSQIYRSVMPDGSIVFSDTPPTGAAATESLPDVPAPAVTRQPDATPPASPGTVDPDSYSTARAKEIDRADAAVAEARRDLDAAKRRYDEGTDPGEGDFLGMRRQGRGHARPSEAYLQRVEQLERDVADAEARLKAAQEAAHLARMR
jgi:hypothetical protein